MQTDKIALFEGKRIRRHWDNRQSKWYFSVVDIVEILTGSTIPKRYWSDLKRKIKGEGSQSYERIVQLKMQSSDGKYYLTDVADTEAILRLIQSIPSPKAEPFKLWLARVGYDRIEEINNPELAMERMKQIYEKKGYSKDWIEKRARDIAVRQDLTDEWNNRGIKSKLGYAILTNEIMQGTFGMRVGEYKRFKGLRKENLRDHMNDLELILAMLGEATTTKFTRDRDSKGFPKLKKDAHDGGDVAGNTRKDIEKRSGKKVSSRNNFLPKTRNYLEE